MVKLSFCQVADVDDALIEYRGVVYCAFCFCEEVRGEVWTYEFTDPAEEEHRCLFCRCWGNRLFKAVFRADALEPQEMDNTPPGDKP